MELVRVLRLEKCSDFFKRYERMDGEGPYEIMICVY